MNLSARQRKFFEAPALSARDRAVSFLHRHPCIHTDAAADAAARAGLTYYASRIPGKESWVQTPEGYRTYLNVPIARTGSQTYAGRELKKNRGYKAEWNLDDNEEVEVFRPLEEVTSPEALASFETKSVLDEHPEGDKILIDALDEFEGYTKGHGHNVRVGDVLESGETSVIADLTVKHPELNIKIDGGVRDISCGYTFELDREPSGRYIQRKIRGNHIAVVPRGRAGSEVGIQDSALHVLTEFSRSSTMSLRALFTAMGFQSWAATQKPEAVADAMKEMAAKDESEEEAGKKLKEKEDKTEGEGGAKDKKKGAKDAEEHVKGCKCDDCMGGSKDGKNGAKDDDLEDVDEPETSMGDGKKGAKDDAEILPMDARSESDFSVGDSIANLRRMRPVIAASSDPAVRKAYNDQVKAARRLQNGVKDGAPDPFKALAKPNSADGAIDGEPEIPMYSFFNGKSYPDGLKAYNEYMQSRQRRA